MAGKASRRDRREFSYGRGFFAQRFVLFAVLVAFVLVFLSFLTLTPTSWVAGIAVILIAYIVIWGLSPLLTSHILTRGLLTLRQGWYFRAFLPVRGIESAEAFDGDAPLGLRSSLARHRLFVTGSKVGLVLVRLKEPRRFWAVLGASADEIVFDVDSRDAFLEALRQREVSLAPVQPERADAHLRE
jgi:hypothetical protein